ncbi:hypothetical protein ACFXMS_44520, partial [Streptomyces sp. NPDC059215]
MAIVPSERVNALIFLLTGERLLEADEDRVFLSRVGLRALAGLLEKLSDFLGQLVRGTARAFPPAVEEALERSVRGFVGGEGGEDRLRKLGGGLREVADGRVQTSMNITESKWQIIAEAVSLLVQLLVAAVLAVFTGGSTAGAGAVARARSQVAMLLVMEVLLRRTRLMPTVSGFFEEAFQAFAVRLALMKAGPDGRRPHGFDWGQIAVEGVAGAFAGVFHAGIDRVLHLDRVVRDVLGRGRGGVPVFKERVDVKFVPGGGGKGASRVPGPGPGREVVEGAGRGGTRTPAGVGPDAGVSGSSWVNHVRDFVTDGASETLAEVFTAGIFYGSWGASALTFVGAGVSEAVGRKLHQAVTVAGSWINHTNWPTH